MLKPSFLSNIAELIYEDPFFKQILLILRGFEAMFRIMTVYGVDLLYCTSGTRRSGGLQELLLTKLHSSRLAGHLGVQKKLN